MVQGVLGAAGVRCMGRSWTAACGVQWQGHIMRLPTQLVLAVVEMSAFVALMLLSGRQERHPASQRGGGISWRPPVYSLLLLPADDSSYLSFSFVLVLC